MAKKHARDAPGMQAFPLKRTWTLVYVSAHCTYRLDVHPVGGRAALEERRGWGGFEIQGFVYQKWPQHGPNKISFFPRGIFLLERGGGGPGGGGGGSPFHFSDSKAALVGGHGQPIGRPIQLAERQLLHSAGPSGSQTSVHTFGRPNVRFIDIPPPFFSKGTPCIKWPVSGLNVTLTLTLTVPVVVSLSLSLTPTLTTIEYWDRAGGGRSIV